MKVRCNNCYWSGDEEDLEDFSEPNLINEEDKTLYFYKGCPKCKTDEYLMDIEDE
jgi:Zn finger protein HypA/HybF involved in hydrogenase expression